MLLKGRLILVIDDDIDICLITASMLRKHGAEIVRAGSVEEAKTSLQCLRYDLILADINVGKESGYEMLKPARDQQIPIIAISGALDAYLAKQDGFDASVEKPFSDDQLLDAVTDILPPLSQH